MKEAIKAVLQILLLIFLIAVGVNVCVDRSSHAVWKLDQ